MKQGKIFKDKHKFYYEKEDEKLHVQLTEIFGKINTSKK